MEERLEDILAEIYSLDSSLKARDGEVRTLVRELMEAQPTVAPDPAFVASLRARVLASRASPLPAKSAPWMLPKVYFAPLGVFAVLLIIFIANPAHAPFVSQIPEPDMQEMLETMAQDAEAPSARTMHEESVMMKSSLQVDEAGLAHTELVVTPQLPGPTVTILKVSASLPGSIRISSPNVPEETLGKILISAGTFENLEIILSRPSRSGETLKAELYYDPDQPHEHLPVYDEAGNPIHVFFMIEG